MSNRPFQNNHGSLHRAKTLSSHRDRGLGRDTLRLGIVAIALGLLGLALPAAAGERPNILVVVADDLGWADVGFHGSSIKTPHIDELARTGVVLDQHYVAPVCSPTRCAFMTGRYWSRFGVNGVVSRRAMAFDTVTVAVAMKAAGYDTAITGKWHLGSMPEWGPRKFGFDHSYGSLGGGTGPYDHSYKMGPYTKTWHRDDVRIQEAGHVTDLIAAEAVHWIESRGQRPFFLYLPFTAVHIPIDETRQWREVNPQIQDFNQRLYAACTSHMDDALGRVLAALERTGKRSNTLIVFFSDNGGYPEARNDDPHYPDWHQYVPGPCGGHNEPLRGMKAQLYEGGIRVPALVQWAGRLKPGTMKSPVHVADWMPTLCTVAGYQPDHDLKWDGQNIWPLLEGQPPAGPRTIYWKSLNAKGAAVRQGEWKLITYDRGKKHDELFDLSHDPYEKENLADRFPERVKDLKAVMAREATRDDDALVKESNPPPPDKD